MLRESLSTSTRGSGREGGVLKAKAKYAGWQIHDKMMLTLMLNRIKEQKLNIRVLYKEMQMRITQLL